MDDYDNIEIFWHDQDDFRPGDGSCWESDDGDMLPSGWYFWLCVPGCMPDSNPLGPYDSCEDAIKDVETFFD